MFNLGQSSVKPSPPPRAAARKACDHPPGRSGPRALRPARASSPPGRRKPRNRLVGRPAHPPRSVRLASLQRIWRAQQSLCARTGARAGGGVSADDLPRPRVSLRIAVAGRILVSRVDGCRSDQPGRARESPGDWGSASFSSTFGRCPVRTAGAPQRRFCAALPLKLAASRGPPCMPAPQPMEP
jgi:hypothetical protein